MFQVKLGALFLFRRDVIRELEVFLNVLYPCVGTILGCYIAAGFFFKRLNKMILLKREEMFEENKEKIRKIIEEKLDELMNEKGE